MRQLTDKEIDQIAKDVAGKHKVPPAGQTAKFTNTMIDLASEVSADILKKYQELSQSE